MTDLQRTLDITGLLRSGRRHPRSLEPNAPSRITARLLCLAASVGAAASPSIARHTRFRRGATAGEEDVHLLESDTPREEVSILQRRAARRSQMYPRSSPRPFDPRRSVVCHRGKLAVGLRPCLCRARRAVRGAELRDLLTPVPRTGMDQRGHFASPNLQPLRVDVS